MGITLPVYIGDDAVSRLVDYCQKNDIKETILVADQNTYSALGKRLGEELKDHGLDVESVVLSGDEVVADAHYILQVLVHSGRENRTYLAVGSGTITDITRFVSHRTKSSFISIPTAPSVDGFTSIGAPIVVAGLKRTFITQSPLAVFVDLPTIRDAPGRLIASGFGDMIGKYTSLADWKLGHVLWDEPYDESIAQRAREAADNCVRYADEVGSGSEEAIRTLMEGLIILGKCMLEFGSSRPASGAEHHCSHYWEMKLLWEQRPALLHGAKVGVASVLIAEDYDKIRQVTREDLIGKLRDARLPDREQEKRRIQAGFGATADEVIEAQSDFLNMSAHRFESLKQRIIEKWDEVQSIAATVPSSQALADALKRAGAETKAESLGLTDAEVKSALAYSHYLRNRFTVRKLSHLFGLQ